LNQEGNREGPKREKKSAPLGAFERRWVLNRAALAKMAVSIALKQSLRGPTFPQKKKKGMGKRVAVLDRSTKRKRERGKSQKFKKRNEGGGREDITPAPGD